MFFLLHFINKCVAMWNAFRVYNKKSQFIPIELKKNNPMLSRA